jgi:membrane protein YdbS with pleckstrin-like domain
MDSRLRIQDIETRVQNVERLLRMASTSLYDASEAASHPECVRESVTDARVLVDTVLELLTPTLEHLAALGEGRAV